VWGTQLKVLFAAHPDYGVENEFLVGASRVRFTRHAVEKFELLKRYGFEVDKKEVIDTLLHPERVDERGSQFFATGIVDAKHALRVVYEKRKDYLVVITFYPVRRQRYGV
jgi:hypothetical protein